MRRRSICPWLRFFCVALVVVWIPPAPVIAGGLCAGRDHTLQCLKRNFDGLYTSDYAGFSEIIRTAAQKARSCQSPPNTASFLDLARFIHGNAEMQEYFGEVVERLCIDRPDCFFDALIRVDPRSRQQIVEALKNPMFMEQSAIDAVFQAHKAGAKYRSIMQLYFDH